ncbi:MAG: AAA family ATPase [Fimbriimonadaceae bacterium]
MITNLKIKHFKAIKDCEIELGKLNVVIGANNSGKSSLIHAIHFSVATCQSAKLSARQRFRSNALKTTLGSDEIIWSPIQDTYQLAHEESLTQDRPMQFHYRDNIAGDCNVEVARGKNKNINLRVTGEILGDQMMSLETIFSIYVPGLAGISKQERFMSQGVIMRTVAQGDANLAFRNVLYLLRLDDVKWTDFIEKFRLVFPTYDILVNFDQATDEYIDVKIKLGAHAEKPIDTAGTGMLQAIQILAYTTLYNPQMLLLDEPDSHLHPNNQRVLCGVLKNISEQTDTQIIISTHSPYVLSEFSEDATIIWFKGGKTEPYDDSNKVILLSELGALGVIE